MTPSGMAVMFALGLAGSLHCVQMCGPLVLSFGLSSGVRPWLSHAAYHLGRILTYSALGALAGWAGSGVAFVGKLAGVEHTAALVGGVFMIVSGLLIFGASRGKGLIQI